MFFSYIYIYFNSNEHALAEYINIKQIYKDTVHIL